MDFCALICQHSRHKENIYKVLTKFFGRKKKKGKENTTVPGRVSFLQQDSGIWGSLSICISYVPYHANISGAFLCSSIPQSLKYIPQWKRNFSFWFMGRLLWGVDTC